MAIRVKRDLRSGSPSWLAKRRRPPAATPLDRNESADVVVIGGGASGALVADAALQSGLTVIAIDRRDFTKGSTPASTALLLFELDQPLSILSKRLGEHRAARAWQRSAQAVSRLSGRITDLGLSCSFRERASVYLPGETLDAAGLAQEATARARIGLRSRYAEAAEVRALTGIEADGAIVSTGSAEVDPVRFVDGLWRSAALRGARLHAPVEATKIDETRSGVQVETVGGQTIEARFAVLATGYELMSCVPAKGHRVVSTFAFATEPQKTALWPSRALIWEAADPYLYLRTTDDGRILAGGEDEETADADAREAMAGRKVAAIGRKLKRLMPDVSTDPEFAWSGFFGLSDDGLPTIGAPPGMKRVFAVMGYGGNGITFSAIAAEMVQRAMIGMPDPDADLFAFGR